jgi:myosin-1
VVKVVKDAAIPRDDMYKSGTIHVGPGESPRSVSRPTPRGKAIARPITSGKLLRPGGPGGRPSKTASRPRPAAAATPRPVPTPAAVNRPVVLVNGTESHARHQPASSVSVNRVPPPAPPPAAPPARVPSKPQAKAKYDFQSPNSNELDISAGDILDILQKEGNGKCHPAIRSDRL